VYALPSNHNAVGEIFWTDSEAEARAEADHMNQAERLTGETLEKALSELRLVLPSCDEERILSLMSIWITEKLQVFQQPQGIAKLAGE
jgi:hypothetical protein